MEKNEVNCYECLQCKACCQVLNIPLKDQTPIIMLLGGDGTHTFVKKRSHGYEAEKLSPCYEISSPIAINHTRTWTERDKIHSIYGITGSSSHWLIESIKVFFESLFPQLQSTVQQYDFLRYKRWNPVASLLCTKLCCSDCKTSLPENGKDLRRNSRASFEHVIVSAIRFFGQSISLNPNHSQPARNIWSEGRVSF